MNIPHEIQKKGEAILQKMGEQKVSLFSKDFWYGSIMDWSMKNEGFKTQMFRFVDVLPSLTTSEQITSHLREYFTQKGGAEELPKVFNVGLGLGKLAPGLMANSIKSNVLSMAKMFIVGQNPQEALKSLKNKRKDNLAFTIDILGEVTLSEKEAQIYFSQYRELIQALAHEAQSWSSNKLLDEDALGPIPKVNISIKMTALYSQINPSAWEHTKTTLKNRLRPLFLLAIEKNVFLNLDMEHYGVKDLTLEVFKELMTEPELSSYRHFGCVIQAYLKDSYHDLLGLIETAKNRKTPFTVRLVKGAYWDTETIEAKQNGWPIPVFLNKPETDANYEDCAITLINAYPQILSAFASHNVRSLATVLTHAQAKNLPPAAFELQMLHGMGDPIKKTFSEMGYRVREYCPMGELIPGMAYLVRRLLENTSNESWLRGKFADNKSLIDLLADPKTLLAKPLEEIRNQNQTDYLSDKNFNNEALFDFALNKHRIQVQKALDSETQILKSQVVPIVLNGELHFEGPLLERTSPHDQTLKLPPIHLATNDHALKALELAKTEWPKWKKTSAHDRAAILNKLADLIQENRYQIIATQCLEVAKPWTEADADIAEAIDFCRYYARHIQVLDKPQQMASHVPGEQSSYHYQPRGVSLVIAPWNFPLAIIAGQTAAALAAGNTVIIKPAEQSTTTAFWLIKLLLKAGLPKGAAQFLPGLGHEVGAFLVSLPDISTIAFTGSKAVGLEILSKASQVLPTQNHVKKCIIEMGGKNAIIIDNDADLDEAVGGVLYSAFGFSGQKCSACSRAIVLDSVYDRFADRLVEATKSLIVGPATDPNSYLGPVIDKQAYERILETIEMAKKNHTLLYQHPGYQTQDPSNAGYYIGPVIFGDVDPESPLAQEEIFGPVLAVMRAKTIDEALTMANSTAYGLTGGLYSRSPQTIETVKYNFECGNLYINRGITGALVERHPFGGFKMSGIGSKTGGPDYLLQFMEPRVVTENVMRRGFAPMAEPQADVQT